ncbi:MAG: hypothetical protein C0503_02600 [Gemmatimonas sp.]|nr:hypothetical protein [Gemmatimonas sp.]
MRRVTLPLLTGLLLLTASARPAAADEGWKEYLDCMKFATIWCDVTRKEVTNFIEGWAVEAGCGVLYLGCVLQAAI